MTTNRRRPLSFLGVALALGFPLSLLAEPVVVRTVRGTAQVKRAQSQSNRWLALKKGTPVKPGDTVRTGPESRLELKLDDGSRVILGARSRVQVLESAPSRLFNLAAGRVKSFVKKLRPSSRFEVRTPIAAASVRGTVFEMGFDEEENSGYLDVERGMVSIAQADRTLDVRAGQRIDFLKDLPLGEAGSRKTQAPAGGVEPDSRDSLRREVRLGLSKEMVMASAAEEMRRAEYQEGKTLIDAFGKRVRLEEYIIRRPAELDPAVQDRAFKLVVLNERDDRFDYFYFTGIFHTPNNDADPLPEDLSLALRDARGKLGVKPDYYLDSYERGLSNTQDAIRDTADGGHLVKVDVSADGSEYTLTDEADPARTRTVAADDPTVVGGETYHEVYDPVADRFVTVTDQDYQAGDYRPVVYNEDTDTFQALAGGDTYWRTSFNNYTHELLPWSAAAVVKQQYVARGGENTLAVDLDADWTYAGDTLLAFTDNPSGEDALHNRVSLLYGDGTTETYDTYIISDEGALAGTGDFADATTGAAFKAELLQWNYQQVTTATEFQGRKIDLVAEPKILIKSGLLK